MNNRFRKVQAILFGSVSALLIAGIAFGQVGIQNNRSAFRAVEKSSAAVNASVASASTDSTPAAKVRCIRSSFAILTMTVITLIRLEPLLPLGN